METTDNAVKGGDVEKVSIVSHPFVFDDDTRTSLTATENSISFAWVNYDALVNNCYWVYTPSYNGSGVAGYIVYAAKSPSDKGHVVYKGKTPSSDYSLSDSHIFLPAASNFSDSSREYSGGAGFCWFSSLDVGSSSAWYLAFGPSTNSEVIVGSLHHHVQEDCSVSVRAVCK